MLHENFRDIFAALPSPQVIPIVHIPGFGDQAAEKVCTDLKISSQNDTKKLAEAKNMVYLKGFTDGLMLVGPHAGKKVCLPHLRP